MVDGVRVDGVRVDDVRVDAGLLVEVFDRTNLTYLPGLVATGFV